jgi:all-trans-retinol 13,14-reductase
MYEYVSLGLFLSGQDVMSCGFVPSLMSGLLAASCVLDKNLVLELAKLHKQLKSDASKEGKSK